MHVCDMHIMHVKRVNVTTCRYATHSRPKLYGQTCTLFKTGGKKELATAILTSIVVNAVTMLWTKKKFRTRKKKDLSYKLQLH